MRICKICGRLVKGSIPGGGSAKHCCVSNLEKRQQPGECKGHLKCAEYVNGAWQIRRHD